MAHTSPATQADLTEPVVGTRVDLAATLRAAAHHDLNEGIDNHFSAMVPGGAPNFLLSPFGLDWSEVRASDLVEIALDGSLVRGDTARLEPTAVEIHRAVHAARPDARCVLHTHMLQATAVACTVEGFDELLSQNSLRFRGRVAYVDYDGLADNTSEAERLATAVGAGVRIVLMANHGALVVGESIAHAWKDLYFLERACTLQLLVAGSGRAARRIEERAVPAAVAALEEERLTAPAVLLEAVKRRMDRVSPGYRD